MNITELEGNDRQTCRLKVDGEMTIYHAQELKEQLLAHAEASTSLELDLSQVAEIDSVGIQILLLLKREADKAEKNLLVSACGKAVREVLGLYRLGDALGIDHESRQAAQR